MNSDKSYSSAETAAIALTLNKGATAVCPRCQGRVSGTTQRSIGRRTTPLKIVCHGCGATGRWDPQRVEDMKLKWTGMEEREILAEFRQRGFVRCPKDGAIIETIEHREIKPPPADCFFVCPQCGRTFDSQRMAERIDPESFEGRFETVNLLGQGGMGRVELVRNRETGALFAAKYILPEFLGNSGVVRRFEREGRILAGLQHPNVVSVRGTFLDEKRGILLMDYLDAGTLDAAINDLSISAESLVKYFGQINSGLKYLHGEGVVHRDLKPQNVLLASGSRALISDFGLSRLIDRDTTPLTAFGGFLGTAKYAAPEQHDNAGDVTSSSDIFSLALIAYEIATRRSPYRQPVSSDGLPVKLQAALRQALSPEERDRPENGDSLLDGLEVWAQQQSTEGPAS